MENNNVHTVILKKPTPWYVWGCIGIVIVLIIASIGAAASGNKTNEPQKVNGADTQALTTTTTPVVTNFYLNDAIKLDDKILTVYSIADYKSSNQFVKASTGNKFVIIDASIENGSSAPITINPLFEFKLQDENSFSYSDSIYNDKNPTLNSETVQAGRKVRGYLMFEVPTSAKSFDLIYTPGFFDNKQIIIKLENQK